MLIAVAFLFLLVSAMLGFQVISYRASQEFHNSKSYSVYDTKVMS